MSPVAPKFAGPPALPERSKRSHATMRKFTLTFALATCLAGSVVLGTAGAAVKPTTAKLTISAFPEGVFGSLSSGKKACLQNRKVVVYERRGAQRDPATDRRVGSDKASLDEGAYRYSVETEGSGRFYARAAATKGCAATLSGSVKAMQVGTSAAGTGDIPPCSPYTAEGPSEICSLQGLHFDLRAQGVRACEFQKSEYSCEGDVSGPFPWGAGPTGAEPRGVFNWTPGPNGWRSVVIISELDKTAKGLLTRMDCRISGPGSAGLLVDKASVKTETGTAEFFTPNLPGQAPGEPGGPLYLNFVNGRGLGADAYINGYLYVKR
jgi:hypothetical protein